MLTARPANEGESPHFRRWSKVARRAVERWPTRVNESDQLHVPARNRRASNHAQGDARTCADTVATAVRPTDDGQAGRGAGSNEVPVRRCPSALHDVREGEGGNDHEGHDRPEAVNRFLPVTIPQEESVFRAPEGASEGRNGAVARRMAAEVLPTFPAFAATVGNLHEMRPGGHVVLQPYACTFHEGRTRAGSHYARTYQALASWFTSDGSGEKSAYGRLYQGRFRMSFFGAEPLEAQLVVSPFDSDFLLRLHCRGKRDDHSDRWLTPKHSEVSG